MFLVKTTAGAETSGHISLRTCGGESSLGFSEVEAVTVYTYSQNNRRKRKTAQGKATEMVVFYFGGGLKEQDEMNPP